MLTIQEIFDEIKTSGGLTPSRRLRDIATRFPDQVAFRDKRFGIWNEITYGEFWTQVQYVGSALNYFGIERTDKVAIHSENRPEWLIADIGIQSLGAISVGLYPTNPPAEVQYLLSHSESKILFAEDQEQVDKALEVSKDVPNLSKIIYFEEKGLFRYESDKLMSWDDFLDIGKTEYKKDKDFVTSSIDQIKSEDVALMIYTSGTTGPPKASMLSHGNMEWTASIIPEISFTPNISNPEYLSYLPLCHVFGRLVDEIIAINSIGVINFAESIDTVQRDLAEIQPSIFPAVPRILERMHAGTLVRMKDASPLKKLLFRTASFFGNITASRRLENPDDLIAKITNFIAQILAFRSLRKKLGLLNVDNAVSGAAPISPEILRFFMSLGVPIYEGYGMTENSAIATGNTPDKVKLGTVGTPQAGTEIKLAEDGEILVRHPGVFLGYYKNEEATNTAFSGGYFHSGDIAIQHPDTYIQIADRAKDIIISGGENISSVEVEGVLMAHEAVSCLLYTSPSPRD